MSTYLIIALGLVAVALVAGTIRISRKKSRSQTPTYVCRHCGEHHCECHLEETGPQDPGRH